jgi:hypothetical protein
MTDEIVMLQLISGDVVMGKVKIDVEDGIELTKPMSLVMNPMQGGIGMIPYLAVYLGKEKESHFFKKSHIMTIESDFMEEFKVKYDDYLNNITLVD